MAPTFGRGAMTNTWGDIKNTNLAVIIGGNAAEAHPCGFKWVTEAKAHNKARLIVVDPRLTRSAAVADLYVPIRAGSDIAWLGGLSTICSPTTRSSTSMSKPTPTPRSSSKQALVFRMACSPGTTSKNATITGRPGPMRSARTATPRSMRPYWTSAASSS